MKGFPYHRPGSRFEHAGAEGTVVLTPVPRFSWWQIVRLFFGWPGECVVSETTKCVLVGGGGAGDPRPGGRGGEGGQTVTRTIGPGRYYVCPGEGGRVVKGVPTSGEDSWIGTLPTRRAAIAVAVGGAAGTQLGIPFT